MYRDASPERRERAAARRRELRARVQTELGSQCYGRVARLAVTDALARLEAEDRATVPAADVGMIERALDALEEALAVFALEAARESERAERYRPLGPPSADAEIFTETFSRFLFAGNPFAWRRKKLAQLLLSTAHPWASQMADAPLVDPYPDGLAFYFEHEGVPLRLNVDIKEFEDGGLYGAASLLAAVANANGAEISVRPQSMGDDILASLGLRRDLAFGDERFDVTYFVSGEESDLRALLTPATRALLIHVALINPARLDVARGIATMHLDESQKLADAAMLLARFGS